MNSRIVVTADGSRTLTADEGGTEIYHSRHGALQESVYVFLRQGLDIMPESAESIRLLEVGFGTGLNAMLALKWGQDKKRPVSYLGVEPTRLARELLQELDYPELVGVRAEDFFMLHESSHLDIEFFIGQVFTGRIEGYEAEGKVFDLCWFDAFSPRFQPAVWTEEIFRKVYDLLTPGGKLVTYSAKGDVQRALKAIGFELERLPGPPGKREMIRATRPA